jgi:hypothetical protein
VTAWQQQHPHGWPRKGVVTDASLAAQRAVHHKDSTMFITEIVIDGTDPSGKVPSFLTIHRQEHKDIALVNAMHAHAKATHGNKPKHAHGTITVKTTLNLYGSGTKASPGPLVPNGTSTLPDVVTDKKGLDDLTDHLVKEAKKL